MVDAGDLLLSEDAANLVVDPAGGFQIMADRLFQHDTGFRRDQPVRAQPFGDRAEQAGRCRQIEDADGIVATIEMSGQIAPAIVRGGIDIYIAETVAEAAP